MLLPKLRAWSEKPVSAKTAASHARAARLRASGALWKPGGSEVDALISALRVAAPGDGSGRAAAARGPGARGRAILRSSSEQRASSGAGGGGGFGA